MLDLLFNLQNPPTIHPLTSADVDQLLSISKETFVTAFGSQNKASDMEHYMSKAFTKEKLAAEIANPFSVFFFAFVDDQIAGYLKLNWGKAQSDSQMGNKGLEIERIYVLAAFQGHRIGQSFVEHAVDFCKKKDKPFIWLGVWTENAKAIQFYQRNGFSIVSSHPFMLGEDLQTDYLMKRKI